ncbi:hypothetical protein KF840_03165 [bacterium]|nr:hypothetical protein [bacterium]
MMRTYAAALLWVVGALSAPVALAEMPYPANPAPCASPGDQGCIEATDWASFLFLPPGVLPDDYRGGDVWKYSSQPTGNPQIDTSAQELFGVTGASIDRAWQTTTGRPDVVIAVLDSGIRWAEPQADLVDKFYLNRGELPVPEGSTNARDPYDRNGDGVFNLADYRADGVHAADSRVSDQNGNGVIDPEDLIFIFSDGVDDDGNGYVDDISGWDFFEDDNDPLDEVRYGHGTGESHDSGSEANNGSGFPGSCPNCLLLEVRVGDSFVTEVNHFAQGVVFAVDSGARVVQEALGTLNRSRFGQQAIDYAYARGTVVIASAADEESNHHNYPATYNHTVQVNSVTKFANVSGIKQSPESYLYLNGCTNYGAHIALAVPSSSCSSEATGRSSGVAGLVVSAALNAIDRGALTPYPRDDGTLAPFPLSAEEVKQILTLTADDINFDARTDVAPPLPQNYSTTLPVPGVGGNERFHSIAGFDQYFGYGRLNADTAVLRVASGQIPPEASLSAPDWFALVDPERTPTLTVRGRVAANRAASFRYVLEAAPGVQPAEADFVVQATGDDLTEALDGALGTIDVAALAARLPHGSRGAAFNDDGSPDPDRFTVTIRVRVVDDRGNAGEDRRALALHHDPDLLPGFPHFVADGGSAPATADLDGDGNEEIILGDANGAVHAWRADGSELPGWPVHTDPLEIHAESSGYATDDIDVPVHSSILGGVSVGDLDRDGTLEVVASDLQGRLYVWQRDGSRRPGFPVRTLPEYSFAYRSERLGAGAEDLVPDRTNRHDRDNRLGRALLGGAALGNLDGSADGSLEIVAGAYDRHLYAWHADGTPVPGWPVLLKDPAKVAAVDPETNEVTLIPGSGAALGTKIIVPPSLGDIDGDGALDVVAAVNEEYVEAPNAVFENPLIQLFQAVGVIESGNTRVYALHADGAMHGANGIARGWNPDAFMAGWPVKTALLTTELLPTVGTGSNGPPALADVDGDGTLEIGTMSAIGPVYLFKHDGVSFFGRHPGGQDRTLESERLGGASNATDKPSFGGLGAVTLARFAGADGGYQLLAPTAGFGKLIDNQLPARQFPAENHLSAWAITDAGGAPSDRQFLPAFPHQVTDLQFLAGPTVADITGDGRPEAIAGSGVYDVHAVDAAGVEAAGWPKFTNGWMVQAPAVGDLDGDGRLEVVATTREGGLFVWRTSGDECGAIPWRRWHHDEWGSGNAETDARPPASLRPQEIAAAAVDARHIRLTLARVPGDGLYCGTAAFDVRVAAQPIVDEAGFAAAEPLQVTDSDPGSRRPGEIVARGDALAGRTVYVGVVARDAAGNRSTLAGVGPVAVPTDEPTATPTPSPTHTASPADTATPTLTFTQAPPTEATSTPTPTLTLSPTITATVAEPSATVSATPTAVPATSTALPSTPTVIATATALSTATAAATSTRAATATAPPTATATRRAPSDGGCAVVAPTPSGGAGWWGVAVGVLLLLRRRR